MYILSANTFDGIVFQHVQNMLKSQSMITPQNHTTNTTSVDLYNFSSDLNILVNIDSGY